MTGSICLKCENNSCCRFMPVIDHPDIKMTGCSQFKQKPMKTNADKIRSMTVEELAEFLQKSSDCPCMGVEVCEGAGADELSCERVMLNWLKQEATE